MGAVFFTSARETSIVSINHAKVNSPNLSGLEHSVCFSTHGHNQEKERDSQERGKEPVFSFRGQWGLAIIARRNVCDSSHTFAPPFGDVWRGYLRKSSPFTSFSPTFGKQTTKFELLFQFRKAESYRPFRGYLRKSSLFTSFLLAFGKLTTKFEMLFRFRKFKAARYRRSSPFTFFRLAFDKLTVKFKVLSKET